ncbi:MAG: S53 family peptidase [Candidatus Eremiobacteraeota bacterium]|nr:S53 family peptidase [Candidatus Eremiobacteraeota bacterium]
MDSSQFQYNVKPLLKPFSQDINSPNALPAPSVCVAQQGLACYTPSEIRTAYNVPSSMTGAGQTIVIVDAYGSATITADLKTFDRVFHLPDPTFNIIYPSGPPATTNNGWAGETSLDVEWAHAIAPAATIDLVIAPTNFSSDLDIAETYAVEHHLGSVMSMSYGAPEQAISGGPHNKYVSHGDVVFQEAREARITSVAATGDLGASFGSGAAVANYPSSDPLVTAVGGTNLFMSDAGVYQSEDVWNDTDASLCPFGCAYGPFGATGGAPSLLFKRPHYQHEASAYKTRTVSDVSYDASVYTAVMVVSSYSDGVPRYYFTGGTSSGTPQWAAIIALADQARGRQIGYVNPALYRIADKGSYLSVFHDVTVGQNALFSDPGFPASAGYDIPTGLGTPNVTNLINALTPQDEEESDHSSDS